MSTGERFLDMVARQLEGMSGRVGSSLCALADASAMSIAAGGFVHLFGSGHSHVATMDSYPRIGGYDGFNPILEPSLTRFNHVLGDDGLAQVSFLEQVTGFGEVILDAHLVRPPDTMVIVSHSGINAVVVDMALGCRARGVTVAAITSAAHSASTDSRHPSGHRLLEVVDIVIDTGAPVGDAIMDVDGVDHRVGAVSTILGAALIQALIAQTAERLAAAGQPPFQIPSHNRRDGAERISGDAMRHSTERWAARTGRRLLEAGTPVQRTSMP